MQKARIKLENAYARLAFAVCTALLASGRQAFAADDDAAQIVAKLAPAAKTDIDFTKVIQPIFESHCYSCHGAKKQESGLRLDDPDRALKGGDLGPAYVPGNSALIPLIRYVAGADDSIVMPPEDSKIARLSATEIGLLRAWIDRGAQRPKGTSAK